MASTKSGPSGQQERKPEQERLSRNIQLRFTDAQYSKLRVMADAAGIPIASLLRRLVDHYLLNEPEPPEWVLEDEE